MKLFLDFRDTFRALRYRNYRLFFAGQSISLIGTWMQTIAMSWLVYRLTNSAFLLGIVGFLGQLPAFLLMPLAGVFADRYNRHRILLITQTFSMLQALVLTVLVITNTIAVWHIIVLSVCLGVINAFDMPVRHAFTVEMIEKREDLGNAIALNSSMVNVARLVGPSVAGILIAVVGEGICFLFNTLSYCAVIVSLLVMKIAPRVLNNNHNHVLFDLREGFRYVLNCGSIKAILVLLSLISLMGVPYQVLMPVFARDIFHGGPKTLGFLMAMAGGGALAGALYLAGKKNASGLERLIPAAAAVFGTGIIVFSFSRVLWFSLLVIFISGFAMMVQMAASNTVLQTIVEEDKRGRVMSFYTMSFMGMVPFGSLFAGSIAGSLGAPHALFLGGLFCIIGAGVFAIRRARQTAGVLPI